MRPLFAFSSAGERRRADLFWADLFGARVGRRRRAPVLEDVSESAELRTWPSLSTLPQSTVDEIIANRSRVPSRAGEIRLAPNGSYALGKNFAPSVLCTPEEDQNSRVKEIITLLNVELGGEGRTASVMTGDAASFTWGLRPRIAMDAVLHRGEGESGRWLLNDSRYANLPPDQVELIKKKVGLG